MKPYLQVEDLTKSYGDRMLFDSVTFGVNEGDKIGLIAKNGTGKSTLLRILSGAEAPDSGNVTFRNGLRVGFLAQMPEFEKGMSIMDNLLATVKPEEHEEWGHEDRIRQMLSQLGIENPGQDVDHLSGGQIKRVALAQVLLGNPDLLILDEPTNHLDLQSVEWLENYLTRMRVTLLMVTHDRYFLDRVCNKIIEIDMKQIFTYEGNFDLYLRRRAERIEALTGELAKVKNTLRKEQEWMRRQPQARAGKARYRINAFYDLKERSRANYDEKQIDPTEIKSSYIGSKIFEAENISKRFGEKVILDDFTYTFAPDSGEWNVGETVRFGYYSQDGLQLPPGKKVIDAITDITEDVVINGTTHYSPMQFLTRFLFSPADQQKYISTLSGGEMRRLHLAAVLITQPNFLILDEPTNDLDIMTLGILEEYLREFKGCVIVISHDRFFLDSIVDHLFVMEGGGVIKDFPGNYTDYRNYLKEQQKATQDAARTTASASQMSQPQRRETARPQKLSFKERKELETLTKEIYELTEEKNSLEALFNSGAEIADIADKARRYSELKEILDEKELRWLELSEKE